MGSGPWRKAGIIAVIATIVFMTLGTGTSQAELDEGGLPYGLTVTASLGYAVPNTDEFGNSFYYRLGAGYSLSEWLGLEVGLGRFSSNIAHGLNSPPVNSVADGDMSITPLTLNLQFRRAVPELFGTVYALAGFGYYFIDYSWSQESARYFADAAARGPAEQELKDSFGFQLGAGFDYPLTAHFFLNLEGQYIFLSPKAEGQWRDLLTAEPQTLDMDIDLNTWIITAGVKYYF